MSDTSRNQPQNPGGPYTGAPNHDANQRLSQPGASQYQAQQQPSAPIWRDHDLQQGFPPQGNAPQPGYQTQPPQHGYPPHAPYQEPGGYPQQPLHTAQNFGSYGAPQSYQGYPPVQGAYYPPQSPAAQGHYSQTGMPLPQASYGSPPAQNYGMPSPAYQGSFAAAPGPVMSAAKKKSGAGLFIAAAIGSMAVLGIIAAAILSSGSSSSAASAANLSGPPQINASFGARKPRKCAAVTHAPSEAQAAALAQCRGDDESETHTYLVQNVKVDSIGSSRAFNYSLDSMAESIDNTANVYDIRGSYSIAQCNIITDYSQNAGKNCGYTDNDTAKGECWRTTFGNWTCSLSGTHSGSMRTDLPGPKSYDEVH